MKSESSRHGRSFLSLLLSMLLVWYGEILSPLPARAFVPTNWRATLLTSPFDETHQSITESAIKDLDSELFGISKLTKPMKKALEQIVDADAAVDKDQTSSAKHFDGESFPEGQARVVGLLADIQTALDSKNAEGARSKLGQALHTIQDFYSHSNWVELGNGTPNSALGRPSGILTRLPSTTATCKDCVPCINCDQNLLVDQLTSGYYGGEDRKKPILQKCSHGGPLDSSTNGVSGGINKDSLVCAISPHSSQHSTAAAVANDATKQFIRDIKALVTTRQLKLLLGVGPTLTLVMDTTGSMSDIQSQVIAQATAIVDARIGTDEEPSKYVLAPFNDPLTGPVTVTDDPSVFKAAISAIGAEGGGDCPELAMTGILQGLAAADDGGDLFMFTDASAKDSSLAGSVSSLATAKDIQIYPMLFGSCSPIDPGFIRIAKESGGQFFFLGRDEAGTVTKLADAVVRANAVNILSVADTFTGPAKIYSFPIDSTLTKITIAASQTSALTLRRPNGTMVLPTDPGVSFTPLSSGQIVTITAPPSGSWLINVSGTGDFSTQVTGESTLDLTSFRFVQPGGRPGHEGYFPIMGSPVSGQGLTTEATLDGPFSTAAFDLRSKAGVSLQKLPLTRGAGVALNQFLGNVTVPTTSFLVYVTGLDSSGKAYQRLVPGLIQLQTLAIVAPEAQDLRAGQTITYTFQVKNVGSADTVQFAATDDQHWLTSINPSFALVPPNGIVNVSVQLRAPEGTSLGTSDTLTFTAESASSSRANSATLYSFVTSAVVGQPVLSGSIVNRGLLSNGVMFIDLELTNTGTGDSKGNILSNLSFKTLAGSGIVSYSALSPPLPLSVPGLKTGDVATVKLTMQVPSSVKRFLITESGTTQNVIGTTYNFSISQGLIP